MYYEKLMSAAIDVVGAAKIELSQDWARDPKIVGLTILCRSISNFRAAMLLVQQRHVAEARALGRCLYETHHHRMSEVTTLIEKVGEVQLLEELAAHFDYLAQDGLMRSPRSASASRCCSCAYAALSTGRASPSRPRASL